MLTEYLYLEVKQGFYGVLSFPFVEVGELV